MYLWNIEGLKEDLQNGLTELEKMKYILATTFVYYAPFLIYTEEENSMALFVENLIYLLLGLGIVYWFYKLNGGNEGKNFLERFTSMNFVLGIRAFVYAIPVPLLIGFYDGFRSGMLDEIGNPYPEFPESLMIYLFMLVFYVSFIYMIHKNLTDLRLKEQA